MDINLSNMDFNLFGLKLGQFYSSSVRVHYTLFRNNTLVVRCWLRSRPGTGLCHFLSKQFHLVVLISSVRVADLFSKHIVSRLRDSAAFYIWDRAMLIFE